NECLGTECIGGFGDIFRTDDVVFHRFMWVIFHEWCVFMCSRMINDRWLICKYDLKQPLAVSPISSHGNPFGRTTCICFPHLHVNRINTIFTVTDEKKLVRCKMHELTA